MVLSTTKKTASIRSITNQNQGGGSKKAGLPPAIGIDSWTHRAYRSNSVSTQNLQTNRFKMFPNQNPPIGFRGIKMH
jgi:hypothetical protein